MTTEIKVAGYVHACPSFDNEYTYELFGMDMSSCGYIPVVRVEIPFTVPSAEDIKSRHLVLLRLKREEVYQEAAKKAAQLDEQISKLESLTYNPTQQEPAE